MIPVLDDKFAEKIEAVKNIILAEINIKEIEFIKEASGILVKKIKPDFKQLGQRLGKSMKHIAGGFAKFSQEDIATMEKQGKYIFNIDGEEIEIALKEVEITSQDIPGWLVAVDGPLTVAIDITITEELKHEGIAREFINRIQNLRKDSGFDVTDKIKVEIQKHPAIDEAIIKHKSYIGTQTLANSIMLVEEFGENNVKKLEIDNDIETFIKIEKD